LAIDIHKINYNNHRLAGIFTNSFKGAENLPLFLPIDWVVLNLILYPSPPHPSSPRERIFDITFSPHVGCQYAGKDANYP